MSEQNIYQTPSSDLEAEGEPVLDYAGFWVRVGASIIDTILILAITFPLLSLIYGSDYWQSERFVAGAWDVLLSYVFPAVAVILFWIYRSATPGKMALGLQVISLGENRKMSVGQSIGRYLGYYPSMMLLMLGVIWVAFDKRKQGWHDKMANTAVVKTR